jgi:Tfp pilus assembly protein FimT
MDYNKFAKFEKQKRFGLPELLIVIFVISIIGVLSLPRIISSYRLSQFTEMQKQVALSLYEAQQESVLQNAPITYRYDNINKVIITYNGNFGALGDARNRVVDLSQFGLEKSEIIYGRPNGVSELPLTDSSNLAELKENSVEITFHPDGSAHNEATNQQKNALFFYNKKYPKDAAFAVSTLGIGGNVKVWRYSKNIRDYVQKTQ